MQVIIMKDIIPLRQKNCRNFITNCYENVKCSSFNESPKMVIMRGTRSDCAAFTNVLE